MPDSMTELAAAINEQTKAINALVESNRELMDYMLGREAEDQEDDEPETFLDGSPAR